MRNPSVGPGLIESPPLVQSKILVFVIQEKELELIKKSLEKHAGKRKLAAKELGISERTLYRKIKQFDL